MYYRYSEVGGLKPLHFRAPSRSPLGPIFWICWPVVARFGGCKARIPIREGQISVLVWSNLNNSQYGMLLFDIRLCPRYLFSDLRNFKFGDRY